MPLPPLKDSSNSALLRKVMNLPLIDKSWSLFLDRDGVINHEKPLDYIYNCNEFIFYDGVLEVLNSLSCYFCRIIIVTNQRGVGKRLMTEGDLRRIHEKMFNLVHKNGGRIDAIYYCTALDDDHPDRKPNRGMAMKAQQDFPEIDFNRSIMVGDSISDMEFGRNVGMYTIYLKTTKPHQPLPHPAIDLAFNRLSNLAEALAGISAHQPPSMLQ